VERVTRGELESKEGEIEKKSREEERFWRKISFSWSHDCLVLFISFFFGFFFGFDDVYITRYVLKK